MKKLTVTAAPGRIVPLPSSILRSPTGAQVKLLPEAPAGREAYAHERVGKVEIELLTDDALAYVRGRIRAGDLIETKPARAARAAAAEPAADTATTPRS